MAIIGKIISKGIKIAVLLLVVFCAGLVWYGWYESTPVLMPATPPRMETTNTSGLVIDYFEIVGADGNPVKACIVKRNDDGELTPRQSRMRDLLKIRGNLQQLDHQHIVLICTSWDDGIKSSMPYAEFLTAAGYTCVLWDPRGKDECREYCTYGFIESGDVVLIVDEIQKRLGKKHLITTFGKGFGAATMMLAAPRDERIRSIVNIDNFCILRSSLLKAEQEDKGKYFGYPSFWLIDMAVIARAGYSSFDVVPVDAARQLNIPAMLVCADEYFFASMDDSIKIFEALNVPDDKKSLYAPLMEGEAYGTKLRDFVVTQELKNGQVREQKYQLHVYDGDDELMATVAEWMAVNTLPPLPQLLLNEAPAI